MKDVMLNILSEIEDEEVGLLLSGGSGSISVLLTLLELGKKISAYTFHMENVESTDLIKAREVAEKYNVQHTAIPLPSDLKTLKEDCLFLVNEVGCKLKTDVECGFPMRHTLPVVTERTLVSGLGDDIFFGTSKKARIHYKHSIESMNEYREKSYSKYNTQFKLFQSMAKSRGIELVSPFQTDEMKKLFVDTSWEEINKPKDKQWILNTYPEDFKDIKCYYANYQKGDSKIADNFLQLLTSDWNIREYKSPVGIYNSIGRGEIIE